MESQFDSIGDIVRDAEEKSKKFLSYILDAVSTAYTKEMTSPMKLHTGYSDLATEIIIKACTQLHLNNIPEENLRKVILVISNPSILHKFREYGIITSHPLSTWGFNFPTFKYEGEVYEIRYWKLGSEVREARNTWVSDEERLWWDSSTCNIYCYYIPEIRFKSDKDGLMIASCIHKNFENGVDYFYPFSWNDYSTELNMAGISLSKDENTSPLDLFNSDLELSLPRQPQYFPISITSLMKAEGRVMAGDRVFLSYKEAYS